MKKVRFPKTSGPRDKTVSSLLKIQIMFVRISYNTFREKKQDEYELGETFNSYPDHFQKVQNELLMFLCVLPKAARSKDLNNL